MSRQGVANIDITATDSRLNRVIKRVSRTMAGVQQKFAMVGKKARNMLLLGGGVVGAAAKVYKDFEKDMAMVSTMLTGKAMDWMPIYREQVSKMSMEFGEATGTMAKGLYDLLSASVAPSKALDVLRIATESAKGGFTTTAVAVDGITSLLNAYGLEANKAGDVSDMMFTTVRRGKITFEELAGSIGKAAPFAKAAGMSMQTLLGTIASLTRQGVRADIAMTQIRSALAYAAKEGLTFQQVIEKFRGKGLSDMLAAGVDRRSASGIAALSSSFKGLQEDLALMSKAGGARLEAFKKYQESFAFAWDKAKQSMVGVVRILGAAMAPVLRSVASGIGAVTGPLYEWIKANKELVASAIKWTAVTLGALVLIPKLIGLFMGLTKVLTFLALTPMGLVVTALGAIMAAFAATIGAGDTLGNRLIDGFKKIIKGLDIMLGSWDGFRTALLTAWEQIGFELYRKWVQVLDDLQDTFEPITEAFRVGWEYATDALARMMVGAASKAKEVWQRFLNWHANATEAIGRGINDAVLEAKRDAGAISEETYKFQREYLTRMRDAEDAARKEKQEKALQAIATEAEAEIKGLKKVHDAKLIAIAKEAKEQTKTRQENTKKELDALEIAQRAKLRQRLKELQAMPKLSEKLGAELASLKTTLFGGFNAPAPVAAPGDGANGKGVANVPGFEAQGGKGVGTGDSQGKFVGISEMYKKIAESAAGRGASPEAKMVEAADKMTEAAKETKAAVETQKQSAEDLDKKREERDKKVADLVATQEKNREMREEQAQEIQARLETQRKERDERLAAALEKTKADRKAEQERIAAIAAGMKRSESIVMDLLKGLQRGELKIQTEGGGYDV